MGDVEPQPRGVGSQDGSPGDGPDEPKDVPDVHDPVKSKAAYEAERGQRPPVSHDRPVAQQAGYSADHTPAEHLPGRPRALPEEEVGHQCAHTARDESGFRAKGQRSDDDDGRRGFKVGQCGKGHAPDGRQRRHNGDGHDLPRLGPSPLKAQEERHHGKQHEYGAEQAGVPLAGQRCPDKQRGQHDGQRNQRDP